MKENYNKMNIHCSRTTTVQRVKQHHYLFLVAGKTFPMKRVGVNMSKKQMKLVHDHYQKSGPLFIKS